MADACGYRWSEKHLTNVWCQQRTGHSGPHDIDRQAIQQGAQGTCASALCLSSHPDILEGTCDFTADATTCICADDEPGHYDPRCPQFQPDVAGGSCTCMRSDCGTCGPKIVQDDAHWADMLDRDYHRQAPAAAVAPRPYSPSHLVGGLHTVQGIRLIEAIDRPMVQPPTTKK